MALFQDFSFSKPASYKPNYENIAPLEESRSSRSPSPFSWSPPSARKPSLSEALPSLTDTISTGPLSARLVGADRRRNSLAREYFETVRSRRQCAVRGQCDSRRASAIKLYIENLLSEESSSLEMHPSNVATDFPSPRRSAPTSSYFEEISQASTEEAEDAMEDGMKCLTIEKSNSPRSGSGGSGTSRQRHAIQKNTKVKTKPRTRY